MKTIVPDPWRSASRSTLRDVSRVWWVVIALVALIVIVPVIIVWAMGGR
jgi:hypothetical protein